MIPFFLSFVKWFCNIFFVFLLFVAGFSLFFHPLSPLFFSYFRKILILILENRKIYRFSIKIY